MSRLPEDVDCTEICGSKLIVKYLIYKIVYLLVLIEYVHQFTRHGMKNMKIITKFDVSVTVHHIYK